jgi:hypothetical protein
MTAKPKSVQDEYSRAAEIAKRDGLVVRPVTIGDETFYVVIRPVNASVHIVRREAVGLACDAACARTRFGHYCAHRAAVRLHLIAERELTNAETDATLQRVSAALDEFAKRDTAPMTDRGSFSIWASH